MLRASSQEQAQELLIPDAPPRAGLTLSTLLLCTAASGLLLWVSYPGLLSPEAYWFIGHYLSGRPVADLIFDPRYTDFGLYQGRELSYLLDYLDTRFIDLCIRYGWPHFLSLTYFTFTMAIVAVLWRFFIHDLKLRLPVALGVVGLYLSSPTVLLWSSLGRSAKVGVTLGLVLAVRQLYRLRVWPSSRGEPIRVGSWLALFGPVLMASLFDRQGVYLAGMLGVYLLIALLAEPSRRILLLLGVPVSALALATLYDLALGPRIIHAVNGYWPDLSYQHLSPSYFLQHAAKYLRDGLDLFLDTWRFMLGNVPAWVGGPLLLVPLVLLIRSVRASRPGRLLAFTVVLMLGLLILMDALMAMRHPPLLDPDMRRMYYWTPQLALIVMALPLLLRHSWSLPPVSPRVLGLLLGAFVLCNLAALPVHHAYAQSRYLALNREVSPRLLEGLRDLRHGQRTDPSIAVDPVYQFFRARLRPAPASGQTVAPPPASTPLPTS